MLIFFQGYEKPDGLSWDFLVLLNVYVSVITFYTVFMVPSYCVAVSLRCGVSAVRIEHCTSDKE